jgi:hypothetical protein
MEWSQWRCLRVALFFLLNIPCGGTVGPALCLKLALLFGHLVCTMPFQRPPALGSRLNISVTTLPALAPRHVLTAPASTTAVTAILRRV